MTIDPDTIQGLITLITLATAMVAAVVAGALKILGAIKEMILELRGIRTDQKAADQVKVAQGQAALAATPGAEPVTSASIALGTGDGGVREAAVNLLAGAAVPPSIPAPQPLEAIAVSSEDPELKASLQRLIQLLERQQGGA